MFVSNVPRVKMGILFRKTRENSVWYVSSESPLTSNKLINSCFARACWQMWFTSSLNVAKVLPVICEVSKCARRISFQFWNIAETLTSRTSRSTMTLNVFLLDCLLSKSIPSLCQLEVLCINMQWGVFKSVVKKALCLHFRYRGTLFKNAPQNRRRKSVFNKS